MQVDRYRRRLESHVAQGQYPAALATLDAWRARSPDLLEPELLHARIDLLRGHYRAARDRMLAVVHERDCPPDLALDVANGLRVLVAHDALIGWAQTYPHRRTVNPAEGARIAAVLDAIGAHALARTWIDEAVQRAPDDVTSRLNRALASSYAGDFEGADTDLEHAIALPQDPAIAHWLLSRLRRQTAATNHVARLRARATAVGSNLRDKEYLHFALFKELDDLGEVDAAWTALDEGCRLARARAPWDRVAFERRVAALMRQFPLDGQPAAIDPDATTPIFILGMHRSGTTLLESMLGAHADVFPYGESQRLSGALRYAADHYCESVLDDALIAAAPTLDYRLVRDRYAAEGRKLAVDATHITEKMQGNIQLIGFIRQAFPGAKIVHLRRDPMDLCFANLRELFADGVGYSYAFDDLAHFHARYRDLMQHWHRCYPGFVLDVDYEALVRDPLATSRRVFDFCGLQWNPRVIEPAAWSARSIHTLSSVQARQPVSASGIGRWRTYAKQLEPLRLALLQY